MLRRADRAPEEGRTPSPAAARARRRRGPGLRVRLTLLATGLVAAVSAVLLWLGWMLVGEVAASLPTLPPQTPVLVDGVAVPAGEIAAALGHSARTEVLQVGSVAFALVVLAAAMVSWVLAGHVLRPVHEVTATARRLSAESLDERIDLEGPRDEVAELADTFDAMLDRLQAAFDAQRRFVANASHELRTPLAVLRTEIDVTLADPDADVAELRRMAGVLRDATRRAEGLVEGLLLLARTEAADHRPAAGDAPGRPGPRRPGCAGRGPRRGRGQAPARRRRRIGRWRRVRGTRGPADTAVVVGDAALLERVVGNLVENAVRHNVEGGWLAVTTRRLPDGRRRVARARSPPSKERPTSSSSSPRRARSSTRPGCPTCSSRSAAAPTASGPAPGSGCRSCGRSCVRTAAR